MKKKIPTSLEAHRLDSILFIVLLIFAILPTLNLLQPGIFEGHDTVLHVARAASFFLSLREGNIIPRWGGNLNFGYGHPALLFYYPAPSYIASALHFLGLSFIDSIKIIFGLSYIGSIFAMYVWIKEEWGSIAGFVAALLYGFAPYRFVDMYVRGAVGEHLAFLWMPLTLFALLKYSRELSIRWFFVSIFSLSALILSHNVITILFLPLLLFYDFYLFLSGTNSKNTFFLSSMLILLFAFSISAFYWIPAYFEGKYTLRDIVSKGDFTDRFVHLIDFIRLNWNYGGGSDFTKGLGWGHLITVFLGIILIVKTKTYNNRNLLLFCLGLFLLSIFLMTSASNFVWQRISLMQKFQFPWRLLTLTTLISSFIGGLVAVHFDSFKRYSIIGVIGIILITVLPTIPMWRAKNYIVYPEEYFPTNYTGTTDASGENSPIWSIRSMEQKPKASIELIDGDAIIKEGSRTTTKHNFTIEAVQRSRFVENTLYYPGWKVIANSNEIPIEFQDPNFRGLMTFFLDPGYYSVLVVFQNTRLRLASELVSMLSSVILIIVVLCRGVVWGKYHYQ